MVKLIKVGHGDNNSASRFGVHCKGQKGVGNHQRNGDSVEIK